MSIKIDLKIFLFVFLFLITSQIEMYILLMIFAIIHELGHVIAGLILKFKPEEIRLTPVGLQVSFSIYSIEYNEKVNRARVLNIKKAIIALAGPMINLFISSIVILFGMFYKEIQYTYIYQVVIYANLLIALFNLIPIYPMDGGRILKEVLHIIFGKKKAYKVTYIISKTVLILLTMLSSIAILYIHNIAILIIIAYLWYLEIVEIRRYNRRRNIEKLISSVENKEHSLIDSTTAKWDIFLLCVLKIKNLWYNIYVNIVRGKENV